MAAVLNLRPFVHNALPEALEVVRSVVSAHPEPLKTKQLYDLVLQRPARKPVRHILRPDQVDSKHTPLPPHPKHPIRSLTYLKKVVLPALEEENFIKKVHSIREMTTEEHAVSKKAMSKVARKAAEEGMMHEWLWQRKGAMPIQKPQPPKVLDAKEIVYGQDISHLNKRRQRSRRETYARELEWVNELEKARTAGARRSAKVAQ